MDEYISFEQIPFGSDDFANNPESRCPCMLLLDTSGSMGGMPIRELNEGIETLKSELMQDHLASKRVEVAMITFGPVSLEYRYLALNDVGEFPDIRKQYRPKLLADTYRQ